MSKSGLAPITREGAFDAIEKLLLWKFDFLSRCEPNMNINGQLKAYKTVYDGLETLRKRMKIKAGSEVEGMRSHCSWLAKNA